MAARPMNCTIWLSRDALCNVKQASCAVHRSGDGQALFFGK
jgi:hypothetical protein